MVAGQVDFGGVGEGQLAHVEDGILMCIEKHVWRARFQDELPLIQIQEAVAENDLRRDTILLHQLGGSGRPVYDRFDRDREHIWLVAQTVYGNDVLIPRLCKELRQLVVKVKRTLGIQASVCPIQPANNALAPAVIPAVLAAWYPVEIQVDAQSVLATVLDGSEKVPPRDLFHVRVTRIRCDSPVRILYSDMVETGSRDLGKVVLLNECRIVLFNCGRSRRT